MVTVGVSFVVVEESMIIESVEELFDVTSTFSSFSSVLEFNLQIHVMKK